MTYKFAEMSVIHITLLRYLLLKYASHLTYLHPTYVEAKGETIYCNVHTSYTVINHLPVIEDVHIQDKF
jgi:hypothetical protein